MLCDDLEGWDGQWEGDSRERECIYACELSYSVMSDSVTPWTLDHQVPLSMEFSRPEYWSRFPFSLLGYIYTYS